MRTMPVVILSAEALRARRRRSVAIGLGLGGLALLFFAMTVAKIAGNLAAHGLTP